MCSQLPHPVYLLCLPASFMDNQLFLQRHSQLDVLPEFSSFSHGSFSDYESDISSPSSTTDGLDFLEFDVPEIFFSQDFDLPAVQSGVIPDVVTSCCPLEEHVQLHPIIPTQNANEYSKNTNHFEEYINQEAMQITPPPSCLKSIYLPRTVPCAVEGDVARSFSVQGGALHQRARRDPDIPGIQGGLIPVDKSVQDAIAPPNTNIDNTTNNKKGNSKPSKNNSSSHTDGKNKKTRPTVKSLRKHSIPDQMKDEKYWRRRLRNNCSARKSREAKRLKDGLIHSKISFLENENENLKMIIARLLAEKNSHQCITTPWSNQIMFL